jgi:hypothetical protein
VTAALALWVLASPGASAGPLTARRGAAAESISGLPIPGPGGPTLEPEIARSLPLPTIVAPVADPSGPDPRLAFLPSDHAPRHDRSQPAEAPIHIPEPASIVLLATGAVGLLARRALRRGQS